MTVFTPGMTNSFRELVVSYLAFHWHVLDGWGDLNDIPLEGLIYKAIKQERPEDVKWIQGGHLPYDLQLNETKIQVKGTMLQHNNIHLSSFRLGRHAKDLKQGILKQLKQNDVWFVVVRQLVVKPVPAINIWFYECDSTCFLYDEKLYDFQERQKPDKHGNADQKNCVYECKTPEGIATSVNPSTSHQLWYKIPFTLFQTLTGVTLVDKMTINQTDLPTNLNLKQQSFQTTEA